MENSTILSILLHLLLIILIIGIPLLYRNNLPTERNRVVGYRTKRSMRSEKSWVEANQYFASLWLRMSLGVATVGVALFFLLNTEDSLVSLCALWVLSLFLQIGFTELHLKRTFDKEEQQH